VSNLTPAIEIKNLGKIYANNKLALDAVNFFVKKGDFFALLGENGAGKSSLIGILTSLVIGTKGECFIHGQSLLKNSAKLKKHIGVVPQEFNFNIFEKVENVLIEQSGYYGVSKKVALPRIEKYLKILGLWQQRQNTVRQLSGGMKRRLMLVRALIHNPDIIILDEPTAGVDVSIRKIIWDFLTDLNKSGKTILLTTHYLEEVEHLCNRVAILAHGKLIHISSVSELINNLPRKNYILDIDNLTEQTKDLLMKHQDGVRILAINNSVLELSVERTVSLNQLFDFLKTHSVIVNGIRTKKSVVESAFEIITKKKDDL
jgi:ABC-2 type transport system ATP-binding protein